MPLTSAERKRRSRASNPEACQHEKEKSRERMSVYRGKNRAQKRARDFKALLTDAESEELASEAKKHKISLLGEWLKSRDLGFSPEVMIERNITNLFVPKIEMHKIEKGVAEFEVAYIQEMLSRQSAAGAAAGDGVAASNSAGLAGKAEYSPQGNSFQGNSPQGNSPQGNSPQGSSDQVPALPPLPAAVTGRYGVPSLPPVPMGKTECSPQGSSDQVPALPLLPAAVTSNDASGVLGYDHISERQAPHHGLSPGANADGPPRRAIAPSDAIGQATDDGKGQQPHEDALNALLLAAEKMD